MTMEQCPRNYYHRAQSVLVVFTGWFFSSCSKIFPSSYPVRFPNAEKTNGITVVGMNLPGWSESDGNSFECIYSEIHFRLHQLRCNGTAPGRRSFLFRSLAPKVTPMGTSNRKPSVTPSPNSTSGSTISAPSLIQTIVMLQSPQDRALYTIRDIPAVIPSTQTYAALVFSSVKKPKELHGQNPSNNGEHSVGRYKMGKNCSTALTEVFERRVNFSSFTPEINRISILSVAFNWKTKLSVLSDE